MEIADDFVTQATSSTSNKRIRFAPNLATAPSTSVKQTPSEAALFTANLTMALLPEELKPLLDVNYQRFMKMTKESDRIRASQNRLTDDTSDHIPNSIRIECKIGCTDCVKANAKLAYDLIVVDAVKTITEFQQSMKLHYHRIATLELKHLDLDQDSLFCQTVHKFTKAYCLGHQDLENKHHTILCQRILDNKLRGDPILIKHCSNKMKDRATNLEAKYLLEFYGKCIGEQPDKVYKRNSLLEDNILIVQDHALYVRKLLIGILLTPLDTYYDMVE